jgi:predicted regulator of Ras-like GTPase activity (Roadblock/LC7/MglB family)
MLERLLAEVADHRGVTDMWLVETDGFVLYSKQVPDSQPPTLAIQDWLALSQNGTDAPTVTLVQENGYVLIRALSLGTLILKAERATNLGSLRLALDRFTHDMAKMET